MKIRVVGAEVYNADGQMEGWTKRRTDGWTDINDEANICFSQFREGAYKQEKPGNQGKLCYLKIIQKIKQQHAWEELYQGIQKRNNLGITNILHQVLG